VTLLEFLIRLFISFEKVRFTRIDTLETYIQEHHDKNLYTMFLSIKDTSKNFMDSILNKINSSNLNT
jgi:hypothetical protein